MFIKFGDKTRKIIVKKSKEQLSKEDEEGKNVIFLDNEETDDRRVEILNCYNDDDDKSLSEEE